ncbi:hypothetical protein OQI_33300, partial [Streptomyces pharetrae CZA14]
ACWRAARDGLGGDTVDLRTGRLEPARTHVERLWKSLSPALSAQEGTLLDAAMARLRAQGNGAQRQRAAYRRRQHLPDVVDHLIQNATDTDGVLSRPAPEYPG